MLLKQVPKLMLLSINIKGLSILSFRACNSVGRLWLILNALSQNIINVSRLQAILVSVTLRNLRPPSIELDLTIITVHIRGFKIKAPSQGVKKLAHLQANFVSVLW